MTGGCTVKLDVFEGPLDLLLHLIKRNEVQITDIPIALITDQYLATLEQLPELNLDGAGEYLVMAATLAEIKSRMLLPRSAEGEEDEEDPRAELVRRLQQYERFKQAAEDIDALPRLERDTLAAEADLGERQVVRKLPEITLKELLIVFREALERSNMFAHHHVQREPLSVRERMSAVLLALEGERYIDFSKLFDPQEGKMGVTVTFLAILELLKESLIDVVQADAYGPIHVRAAQSQGGETAEPKEAAAGNVITSATDEQ